MSTHASTSQAAAIQANSLAALAIDSLDVGVIAVDQNACVIFTNAHTKRLFPNANGAQNLSDYLSPVDSTTTWRALITAVQNSLPTPPIECEIVSPAPSSKTRIYAKCVPLSYPPGQSTGAVITILDERIHNEGSTDEQELLQRLASLGKLTSCVAHELNNPLDGILRYTNLALRLADAKEDDKLSKYLQESRTGIKRMVQIISDLLAYSRTSAKDFDISNINEIVEQAAKSISELVDDQRLEISLDLHHKNMPSVSGSRLYQVCCNLMKNACDAMPAGGQLAVSTRIENDHVVIRFADTGTGLPDDLQDIFQPFTTSKSPGKGTGLGLAICRDFIEGISGTIVTEPNRPHGAIFIASIPLASCMTDQRGKDGV